MSELRRRDCDPAVASWSRSAKGSAIHLSVITLGEIRRGIVRLERRDAPQARLLATWLAGIAAEFADRILDVTGRVADRWGALDPQHPVPMADGLISATAIVHDLTLVTRNVRDVERTGVRLLNPWEYR